MIEEFVSNSDTQLFIVVTCIMFWVYLSLMLDQWFDKHPPKRTLAQIIIKHRYDQVERRYREWLCERKDSIRLRNQYSTIVGKPIPKEESK